MTKPLLVVTATQTTLSWTESREEALRLLWAKGRSGSEIANELGGVTRNAVIGKANRMGLPARKRAPQANAVRKPRVPKGTAKKVFQAPRIAAGAIGRPILAVVPDETTHNPRKIELIDLTADDCRYPYGDGPFTFCGCPKLPNSGLPYCQFHCSVVARPRVVAPSDQQPADKTVDLPPANQAVG